MNRMLLEYWGIDAPLVEKHQNIWQVGDKWILKVYTDRGYYEKTLNMVKCLSGLGVPVAAFVQTLSGEDCLVIEDKIYTLTTLLKGAHEADPFVVGAVIARLHQAFRACEEHLTVTSQSLLLEMKGWIKETLEAHDFPFVSQEAFEAILDTLDANYGAFPVQLIHRDFHMGNLLFENGALSGYIDFDLSHRNIRIFDVAYCLTGMMQNGEVSILELVQGYESVEPLEEVEKTHLKLIMKCIELLFIAYYLKVGNREQAQNASELFYRI